MENKNDIKLMYDYKKIKNSAIILTVAGIIEIIVCFVIGKIDFMIIGVLLIFTSSQNLKPITKENMALKSLIINDKGISIESDNGIKNIEWININNIREYNPTASKQAYPIVEIVTNTGKKINFSYKNFIKVRKIRKSLKYFCTLYKVKIVIK